MKTESWLAFIFGVVFLLISLLFALIAFYLPKPANPEVVGNFLFVMQVALALAASGVAAVIPGFLSVTVRQRLGQTGRVAISATGAIAVFVIVFLVNPRSITLDQMNKRVGYNEYLQRCRNFNPVVGSSISGALQYCMDARDFDPVRWEAYRELARIYLGLHEYKKSIESYKTAIKLMTGLSYAEISRPDQIKSEFRTDTALMFWGIAVGFTALAKSRVNSPDKELDGYKNALLAVGEAIGIAQERSGPGDQLYNDLLYLRAADYAHLWLVGDINGLHKDHFDRAVRDFNSFLMLPGAIPQWAEYHLACLYSEAAKRFTDVAPSMYLTEARNFVIAAVTHILRTQNERSAIQSRMLKCRLINPEDCETSSISDPILCPSLTKLVERSSELQSLIAKL